MAGIFLNKWKKTGCGSKISCTFSRFSFPFQRNHYAIWADAAGHPGNFPNHYVIPQALHFSFSDCEGFKDFLKHEDAEITQIRAGSFINTVSLVPLERMVFRYGTKSTPWIAAGSATPGHVSLLMDLNYRQFPTVNGIRQEGSPWCSSMGRDRNIARWRPETGSMR